MNFQKLYDFLEELQKNNHKTWMDNNRSYYHEVRDWYIGWLDDMNIELAKIDPDYTDTPGKKAINRINNNLMFHPDKPTYKDHFGAGLDQETKQGDFYIHLGVNESFIAGGYYHPSNKILKSIRDAIDYDGEKLLKILNKKSFKQTFGGLMKDPDKLKSGPKGYSQDHPYIELLKHKSFAVQNNLSKKEVLSDQFPEKIITVYKEMLPFRRYLNKAVSISV
jgi:uncharacterized protein (TIGR02453 family)